jgi:hypothetical protein
MTLLCAAVTFAEQASNLMMPARAVRELRAAALVCVVWWTGLADVVIRGDIPSAGRGRLFAALCVAAAYALARVWTPGARSSKTPATDLSSPSGLARVPRAITARLRSGRRRESAAVVVRADRREPVHRSTATT